MRLSIGGKQSLMRVAALCLGAFAIQASDMQITPVGSWKTVDDKTGQPKSIVRIYEENGRLFGKVDKILNPERAAKKCDLCTDDRKGQPIAGMVIMRGLTRNGQEYSGGDILDPDNGSVYRCKLRLTDRGQKLVVRGYIGFSLLGRSQTWSREP